MKHIKPILKNMPAKVIGFLKTIKSSPEKVYELYLIKTQPLLHRRALKRLKQKDVPLNVVFFAIFKSVWKYDKLYWLLEKDPRFHPIVLVCPAVNYGREEMLRTLYECYSDFKERGYCVICSYDEQKNVYVDARSLSPDIIFYTNPYKGLIDNRYYITHFRDVLTCYVNYGYSVVKHQWGNALLFHKILWRHFCECEGIYQFIVSLRKETCFNCVISGYPAYDDFLEVDYCEKDWKQPDSNLKRIIWAPHHTIEETNIEAMIRFSNFFQYADFMQEMAVKYADKIQIVFKPHPLLRHKLYKHPEWGIEKTDRYFGFWENCGNTNYVSGDYRNLFKSSDAMIHDCGSFTMEYLYLQKPVMYISGYNHQSQLNKVALQAYNCHYIAKNRDDVEYFIVNTVIGGNDPMCNKRKAFYDAVLTPPNSKTVAENMFDSIVTAIFD